MRKTLVAAVLPVAQIYLHYSGNSFTITLAKKTASADMCRMAQAFSGGTISIQRTQYRPVQIANWLMFVALLVFLIVVVGGITRLTESGLSITEWKPVSGILPPLSQADWIAEFARYQGTTEFQTVNQAMTLADFKFIYFWEYIHRLIGRLIGFAFVLPFAWFAWKRAIPTGYTWRLLAVLALGAMQGAIGWWMVRSGLTGRTDVSHYRLAVHLLNALLILGGLLWTALDLRQLAKGNMAPARLTGSGLLVLAVLAVQLLFGAYVAGMDAGHVANTWPLMNEHFVPEGIDWSNGTLSAFANDPFLVHFTHRWWAWLVAAMLLWLSLRVRRTGQRLAAAAILTALGVQILLGISTVVSNVNIELAVMHQAVGALLVMAVVWGVHITSRRTVPNPPIAMQLN